MDNYNYHKGMNGIIQELKCLLNTKNIGTDSDQALLLDFQAALETKPEKAIKLEKDALAQIETITASISILFPPFCKWGSLGRPCTLITNYQKGVASLSLSLSGFPSHYYDWYMLYDSCRTSYKTSW